MSIGFAMKHGTYTDLSCRLRRKIRHKSDVASILIVLQQWNILGFNLSLRF